MGLMCCKCCCSCKKNSSVGVLPTEKYKVILLGLPQSGKTEVGHCISRTKRTTFESTNGVQFFQVQTEKPCNAGLYITEIGGSEEMQKIWHHYYVMSMGIIYCFDMSSKYEDMQRSFELLQCTLAHPFVRGKPVLVVASKADLANSGLFLYDIENTFFLEALARKYKSSLLMCYCGRPVDANCARVDSDTDLMESLEYGVNWLVCMICANYNHLRKRIKCDTNIKLWQQQMDSLIAAGLVHTKRYRFKHKITPTKIARDTSWMNRHESFQKNHEPSSRHSEHTSAQNKEYLESNPLDKRRHLGENNSVL